jgi:hypothetical protein
MLQNQRDESTMRFYLIASRSSAAALRNGLALRSRSRSGKAEQTFRSATFRNAISRMSENRVGAGVVQW